MFRAFWAGIPLLFTTNLRVIWRKIVQIDHLSQDLGAKTRKNDVNPQDFRRRMQSPPPPKHPTRRAAPLVSKVQNPYDMNHKILIGFFWCKSRGEIIIFQPLEFSSNLLSVSGRVFGTTKKNLLLSIQAWLFNREPYFIVYEIIPTQLGRTCHPLIIYHLSYVGFLVNQ